MKKKLFYLSIIFFAIILLLLLGTTKVNADGERIGDWDVLFVDEEGSVYYDYESLDSSIHEYKWSLINEYHGNETNLTIPSSFKSIPVSSIEWGAFQRCNSLKSVVIPSSIIDLDWYGFADCKNLTDVTFQGATDIGYYAFQNCTSLKNIFIPKAVTFIGKDAFKGCKNLTITCDPDSRALQVAFDEDINYKITSKANIKSNANIDSYIETENKTYSGKAKKTYISLYYYFGVEDRFEQNTFAGYELVEGKDYTVSYANNINVGTATVTITGKGNYTGTITKTFKIVPSKVTIKSAKNSSKKAIKVKWNKDTNATGYEVYISEKVVDNNYMTVNARELSVRAKPTTKSYEYDILGRGQKVRILKRNVKKANGYTWYKIRVEEEAYTTEGYVASEYLTTAYKAKKYKNVKTITKNSTTSYTIKNLKKGKTYYVKVRSYKTVNGKKYYSNYSTVKTIKIKK